MRLAVALLLLATLPVCAAPDPTPTCPQCGGALPAAPVVVLDTKAKRETACCDVVCALALVRAGMRTAIITVPPAPPCLPQETVKLVRTGERWTALPPATVFLWAQAEGQPAVRRAFPSQARYIQFLAQHKDLAAAKPTPLKLEAVLARLADEAKPKPPERKP